MALTAGTRFGPYEIETLLGAGGMGEVYKARDTRLDRTVAIKILAPEIASDPPFKARFEREARSISALRHPHICVLYDIGAHEGVDYLVLEHLEGETLVDRLQRESHGLKLSDALPIATNIADALDAAHRHGLVHRDLKPGNVMLTPGGAKLLDFGLAKQGGSGAARLSMLATQPGTGTAQGMIVGTLQYMAPEQIEGRQVDARTDVFALGAVLYEMLTGRKAFEAQTQASLIAKILASDPPALSTLVPVAPPALNRLVQRCLAKNPDDRWQNARDVLLELRWIDEEPEKGGALTPGAKGRRQWLPWLLTATVVLIAASAWNLRPAGTKITQPSARCAASTKGASIRPKSGWTSPIAGWSVPGRFGDDGRSTADPVAPPRPNRVCARARHGRWACSVLVPR
jgi:serine/threonine protein kinase